MWGMSGLRRGRRERKEERTLEGADEVDVVGAAGEEAGRAVLVAGDAADVGIVREAVLCAR